MRTGFAFGIVMCAVAAVSVMANQLPVVDFGKKAAEAKVVEPSMHEFMEYVFQPTYKRLKVSMAAAPADNNGWKAIKADSLILAEAGNLLLLRKPEENLTDWEQHSVAVRELGAELYAAARKKDFPTARTKYEALLKSCNACHTQFADGEHMLQP